MPITNSGVINFLQDIERTKVEIEQAIEDGVIKNCRNVCSNAYFNSRIDTGTMRESYQLNNEESIRTTGEHQKQAWSNPSIIATNPKHPNGEYYPYLIEYGWIDKSGVFHQGDHMWESASTLGKNDLLNDISEEINKKVK